MFECQHISKRESGLLLTDLVHFWGLSVADPKMLFYLSINVIINLTRRFVARDLCSIVVIRRVWNTQYRIENPFGWARINFPIFDSGPILISNGGKFSVDYCFIPVLYWRHCQSCQSQHMYGPMDSRTSVMGLVCSWL